MMTEWDVAEDIADIVSTAIGEMNTIETRGRIVTALQNYCEQLRAIRGIYDYDVVCDERNNPPALIDQYMLVADVTTAKINSPYWEFHCSIGGTDPIVRTEIKTADPSPDYSAIIRSLSMGWMHGD